MSFLFAAALALLQDPAALEPARPATDAEIARLTGLLRDWAKPWEKDLPGLDHTILLIEPRFVPVVQLGVITIVETRALRRSYAGYHGSDLPKATVHDADPDSLPAPALADYETHEYKFPVPKSQSVLPCKPCKGSGTMPCSPCGGDGKIQCSRCSGTGDIACDRCRGNARVTCTMCGGAGQRGVGRSRGICGSCGGSGRKSCGCTAGKKNCTDCGGDRQKRCSPCSGNGKNPCRECSGTGKIIQGLVIHIRHEARGVGHTITELPSTWSSRLPEVEPVTLTGDGIDHYLARISNSTIRDAIRSRLPENPREVIRGKQVRISWIPSYRMSFEYEGRSYECMAVDSQLEMETSPLQWKAGKLVAEARSWLEKGDVAAAKHLAREALRLDSKCAEALEILAYVKPSPPVYDSNLPISVAKSGSIVWMVVVLGVLFLVGVGIAAAVVTWISIKLSRRRR